MKTIAVTIDDAMVDRLDDLASQRKGTRRNRSALVRQAVREFVQRVEQTTAEDHERRVLHQHRSRLQRQAAVLVREQAQP